MKALLIGEGIGRWLYRLYNYLQTWQRHRDTVLHLNRMTDKQLEDVGLKRADINDMVWFDEHKEERGPRK
jgi:uncharacterized protein YjiS (DUF1127 family)